LSRSVTEDWDCADVNADGVVTAYEFKKYAFKRLKAAKDAGLLQGPMDPVLSGDSQDKPHFIAYSHDRYFNEGVRDEYALMALTVPAGKAVMASIGTQSPIICIDACEFLVPKKAKSELRVTTFSLTEYEQANAAFVAKFGYADLNWSGSDARQTKL